MSELGAMRLFEVTVRSGSECYSRPVSARSAAAAKYRAYLDADLDVPFGEYQRRCSVRLHRGELADDGYDYVRRYYGKDVRIGMRIKVVDEGPGATDREGEVAYPHTHRHYVHVALDGSMDTVMVHPGSVVPAQSVP